MRVEDSPLSAAALDRDTARRSEPDLLQRLTRDPLVRVLTVRGSSVASTGTEWAPRLQTDPAPSVADAAPHAVWAYLGRAAGETYLARLLPDVDTDTEPNMMGLRGTAEFLPEHEGALATAAVALANWHGRNQYCPRCGHLTAVVEAGWVRRCPIDGTDHFPRTDPAVIMAITDPQERLLLARSMQWPQGRFSVPAGFVEPGEPLELAVRREIVEETRIHVGDLTYRGTQPWPFPASLMCGFTGVTTDEAPEPDGVEIAEARFFTRAELDRAWRAGTIRPPGAASIAHALIAQWFGAAIPQPDPQA